MSGLTIEDCIADLETFGIDGNRQDPLAKTIIIYLRQAKAATQMLEALKLARDLLDSAALSSDLDGTPDEDQRPMDKYRAEIRDAIAAAEDGE